MDVDHKEGVSSWMDDSTTTNIKKTPSDGVLKQSHSTLNFSTPIHKRHDGGEHGFGAIHPEPSKEDMALNSPFKLAQQIFPKKAMSREESVKGTPSHVSPVKSVGSAGSMRRRAMILGKPMFSRRHYKEKRNKKWHPNQLPCIGLLS